MPGWMEWVSDPWGKTKKALATSFAGEVPTPCGPQLRDGSKRGFIGNTNAKNIITDLEEYIKNVKATGAVGTRARDKGAISFNKKAIELLKMYRKELENFKKFDFFASSTLKRLKNAKEKMREILNQLKENSKTALSKYSDDSMRKAAQANDDLKGYVPIRIWHDFVSDMIADIETTLKELDNVINLEEPDIDFKKLQMAAVKTRVGKKDIKRREIIEKNVLEKQQKDAEAEKKKVESYLKEAEKIHNKVKAAYKKAVEAWEKITRYNTNEQYLDDAKSRLNFFNDDVLFLICQLVGLGCCESKETEKVSKGSDDYSIKAFKQEITSNIMGATGADYVSAIKYAAEVKEKLEKIKQLEKESQKPMKEIQALLAKAAKIKAWPEKPN